MVPHINPKQKIILITGCSTGSIGGALAKEFNRRGFHVIATARSLTRLQELEPLGVQVEELDVTLPTSIQALRSKISSLDILFNNAGGLHMGFISDSSMQGWRNAFDQNFFSVVEVTRAFLPLILESKGVIVNHSSQTPYFAIPGTGLYAVSKKAVCHYTDVLRTEMHPFGVRVVELMTGVASSNILKKQMKDTPYKLPPDSIYSPVKHELEKSFAAKEAQEKATDLDVYAKKVVSDLLDGGGWFGWLGYERPWIWQGFSAGASYWLWLAGCFWKGLWDPMFRRLNGLYLLKARLQEKEKTQ